MTHHAQQRWDERFSHLHLPTEWAQAKRAGKKTRAKIKAQCPAHEWMLGRKFEGRYVLLSRNDVVFIVAPPHTVITVFPYTHGERRMNHPYPRCRT